jgi:hypothetical protein
MSRLSFLLIFCSFEFHNSIKSYVFVGKSLDIVEDIFSNHLGALWDDQEGAKVLEVIEPGGKSVKNHEN